MMEFKDRFKELRLEKGLTLKEVGVMLGFSESNMSLYESGKREPKRASDYIKIADYFNVSLDYLMGRSGKEDITLELKELISNTKDLTDEQIKALNVFLKSMKK